MGDAHQPKKETVRITLPPPPRSNGGESGDTVRIHLPPPPGIGNASAPQPTKPLPRPPAAPLIARPPAITSSAAPVRPPTITPSAAATSAGKTLPPPMPPRPRVLPPAPRVLPPTASANVSAAPSHYPGSASQSGPKKETARISILPEPTVPTSTAVKMSKTQPLLMVPSAQPAVTTLPVKSSVTRPLVSPTPPAPAAVDRAAIPLPLVWAAFGISAVALLIQIWNYFSS